MESTETITILRNLWPSTKTKLGDSQDLFLGSSCCAIVSWSWPFFFLPKHTLSCWFHWRQLTSTGTWSTCARTRQLDSSSSSSLFNPLPTRWISSLWQLIPLQGLQSFWHNADVFRRTFSSVTRIPITSAPSRRRLNSTDYEPILTTNFLDSPPMISAWIEHQLSQSEKKKPVGTRSMPRQSCCPYVGDFWYADWTFRRTDRKRFKLPSSVSQERCRAIDCRLSGVFVGEIGIEHHRGAISERRKGW